MPRPRTVGRPPFSNRHQSKYPRRLLSDATRALKAGALYFALVFAAGFALGAIRVLLVVPYLDEFTAVLLELPLMLGISWLVCGWVVTRLQVPSTTTARFVMGALAFGLLIAAEILLSVVGFDRSMEEYLHHFGTPQGLLGLTGQLAFALMPLVRRRD